jgi:hypothetical protein
MPINYSFRTERVLKKVRASLRVDKTSNTRERSSETALETPAHKTQTPNPSSSMPLFFSRTKKKLIKKKY